MSQPLIAGHWRRWLGRSFLVALAASVSLGGSFAAPSSGNRANRIFTVANYPVEATDKNAVAAKDRALAEGQQAAFRSLLKRIVPVTAYKQLARLASVKAADLVTGVSVRAEQNSATDYIASLDFSFEPDAVRSVLARENIPFVETQAPPLTVIPVLRKAGSPSGGDAGGPWARAWKLLDLDHTVTPVRIEDLRAAASGERMTKLLEGDDAALRALSGEYKSELVVVALAEPDTDARKFNVTLAGRDGVGPFLLKRSYRMADGDTAYASEFAAVVSLGIIEGRWKAVRSQPVAAAATDDGGGERPAWAAAPTSGSGENVRLMAQFASQPEWNEIRAQLLETPGVEALEIGTISAQSAEVALTFPGGPLSLANALGARGLFLENLGDNWVLRARN